MVVGLNAWVISPIHEILSCTPNVKCIPYFFLCQIQDIWYYVEVLGMFRVEFCGEWDVIQELRKTIIRFTYN